MRRAFTSLPVTFRLIFLFAAALGLLLGAPILAGAQARPGDLVLNGALTGTAAARHAGSFPLAHALPRLSNALVIGGSVTIATVTLPDGKAGQPYSAQLVAAAGVTPYRWEILDAGLPHGLLLESTSGIISGTPSTYGVSRFIVTVTDSHVPPGVDYKQLSIEIDPIDFQVLTGDLTAAVKATAYRATLQAVGGTNPYTWSLAGGTLPAGLSLESTGVIVGTPAATGAADFTVQVIDSASTAATATKALSLRVIGAALAITPVSLPHAVVAVPYSQTLAATGGIPPYSWRLLAGALPPGISLESASGTISGTTRTPGPAPLVVQVSDSQAAAATDSISITLTVDANHDSQGPLITAVSAQPTIIRHGIENSLTLTATADDSTRGGSTIDAFEYFTGADPGLGHGAPMSPADGSFDSTAEVATALVDTSSWTTDTRVFVRAQDQIGNWGNAHYMTVRGTTDVTPPGQVKDLSVAPMGTFVEYSANSHDFSSAGSTTPATNLFDGSSATWWQTIGTTVSEKEYVTFDLTAVKSVGAVTLTPAKKLKLFPSELTAETSPDGSAWTKVFGLKPPKKAAAQYLWQFEPTDARYIRISGPGVRASDKHYYWRIADALACQTGGPILQLTFTAPGNDGYSGARACQYDARYSATNITEDNFLSCPRVYGLGNPKTPAQIEKSTVRVDSADAEIYMALKTVDDVGNWSPVSNVITVKPLVSGFVSLAPADETQGDAVTRPTFAFRWEAAARSVSISFSSSLDFASKRTTNSSGVTNASVKFALKPTASSWTPTSAQWKAIKTVVQGDTTLYWRLQGMLGKTAVAFGPARTILFDSNKITDLSVSQSGTPVTAICPDKNAPVTFLWANGAAAMVPFYVDVSTDAAIPISNKKKTLVFTVTDPGKVSKLLSASEWKKMRKLATAGGGTLYWRVRAKDAQKALTIVSVVKKLVIDPGSWALGDLDLNSTAPAVSWPYTGQGMVTTSLQFSVLPDFSGNASKTLKVPAASTSATSRSFTAKEVTRIKALATRNGTTTLYYRVRGEDGDKAFIGYGDVKTLTP